MQSVDPAIDHRVRAFLKVLNSGGGKSLEELTPRDVRSVLTGFAVFSQTRTAVGSGV